jgi:hypothetical protein
MRFSSTVLGLCLAFAFAACGADTSTPVAGCNSVANAACNKDSSCNQLGGTSVAECITATELTLGCATITCPSGTSYNGGAVSQCISDINGLSCPVNAAPTSCQISLFCS